MQCHINIYQFAIMFIKPSPVDFPNIIWKTLFISNMEPYRS